MSSSRSSSHFGENTHLHISVRNPRDLNISRCRQLSFLRFSEIAPYYFAENGSINMKRCWCCTWPTIDEILQIHFSIWKRVIIPSFHKNENRNRQTLHRLVPKELTVSWMSSDPQDCMLFLLHIRSNKTKNESRHWYSKISSGPMDHTQLGKQRSGNLY